MLLNNRYQILQVLGVGGFGETFLAEDTQMPSKRRCVIKQLKPITNNLQVYQLVQERFKREAATQEELGESSDQIPSLYAYFQLDGQFYLVQEWIQGDTLSTLVQKQGLFNENSVREILISLLPVTEYIHSRRIIHRDIKPDNIILRYRDRKPVLIDFGAVREIMGTGINSQGNPVSSIIIGTPGFMPSEQAMGRPIFASDIYSLGMTAIYLLTGKQPQELETDAQTGEILWRNKATNVSPELAAVIDKAIAYHPRDRYATAREMYAAIVSGVVPMAPTLEIPDTVTPTQPPSNIAAIPSTAHQAVSQNTIPIIQAPPSHQPVHQSSGTKGIILGSLLAGGIIGSSVIIGLTLTRQPQQQPIAIQPTVQPTVTVQPTITPTSQPQESRLPQQHLKVIPTPSAEITPKEPKAIPKETASPQAKQTPLLTTEDTQALFPEPETKPTPAKEPSSNSPVNSSLTDKENDTVPAKKTTPIPDKKPTNNTKQTPTQTPKTQQSPPVTPTVKQPTVKQPTPKRPSTEEVVRNYYININQGDFKASWNMLSDNFRTNRKAHPKGYDSYVDWWGRQIQRVEINQIKPVQTTAETATVDAQLTYELNSGKSSPTSVRFYLVWDENSGKWVVKDAQRVRG